MFDHLNRSGASFPALAASRRAARATAPQVILAGETGSRPICGAQIFHSCRFAAGRSGHSARNLVGETGSRPICGAQFSRSCRFAAGRSGHGSANSLADRDRDATYLRSLQGEKHRWMPEVESFFPLLATARSGPRLRTLRSRRPGTALHRTGRHPRRRSGHGGRLHALPVRQIASRLWRRQLKSDEPLPSKLRVARFVFRRL